MPEANLDLMLMLIWIFAQQKNNEKQQQVLAAMKKAVDNFSFGVPLHENIKAQKNTKAFYQSLERRNLL